MRASFIFTLFISFTLIVLAFVLFRDYGEVGDEPQGKPETSGPTAYAKERENE